MPTIGLTSTQIEQICTQKLLTLIKAVKDSDLGLVIDTKGIVAALSIRSAQEYLAPEYRDWFAPGISPMACEIGLKTLIFDQVATRLQEMATDPDTYAQLSADAQHRLAGLLSGNHKNPPPLGQALQQFQRTMDQAQHAMDILFYDQKDETNHQRAALGYDFIQKRLLPKLAETALHITAKDIADPHYQRPGYSGLTPAMENAILAANTNHNDWLDANELPTLTTNLQTVDPKINALALEGMLTPYLKISYANQQTPLKIKINWNPAIPPAQRAHKR